MAWNSCGVFILMEDEMLTFSFVTSVSDFITSTKVMEQIQEVEATVLFTNPWFLVPFIGLTGYMIHKQAWRDIIILIIFIGAWYASRTEYMQPLVAGDELQLNRVLSVALGGVVALGLVVYLLISRD